MHSSVRPNNAHWKWCWRRPAALPGFVLKGFGLIILLCWLSLQFCPCHKSLYGFIWIFLILWIKGNFWKLIHVAEKSRGGTFQETVRSNHKNKIPEKLHPSHRTFRFVVLVSSSHPSAWTWANAARNWTRAVSAWQLTLMMNFGCLWLNLFYPTDSVLLCGARSHLCSTCKICFHRLLYPSPVRESSECCFLKTKAYLAVDFEIFPEKQTKQNFYEFLNKDLL